MAVWNALGVGLELSSGPPGGILPDSEEGLGPAFKALQLIRSGPPGLSPFALIDRNLNYICKNPFSAGPR